MTLVIPPGFGSAAFIFNGTEGTPTFVTTMGVDLSAASGDFVGAANELMTGYATAFEDGTDSLLTLARVNLAVGDDGPGGSVDSDLAPIPMARSGTSVPIAMAAIMRKSTNELGRRGRGRCFLPGVLTQAEVNEGGQIGSGRIATLSPLLDAWHDILTGTTSPFTPYPPVLLHSSAPTDPTPITGFALAPLVGWIRGRIR